MDSKVGLAVAAGIGLALWAWSSAKAEPKVYTCAYCGKELTTLEELQAHVQTVHPGERIPIEISWQ